MKRHPRNLVAIGAVFVVLSGVQVAVTDLDALAFGAMTGGAIIAALGAVLWMLRRQ